jgi:xylulokinase
VPLVLGVGSSRTTTVAEVRDADSGRLVGRGSVEHGHADDAEQGAERWWDALVDAVAATGVRRDVAALAVTAQRQALVLLDGAGATLGPATTRADDRASSTAAAIVERLGATRLARATGHVPGADSPLARLAWRFATDPEAATRTGAVLGAHEMLTFRLTGRRVTDRGGASTTGWWNPTGDAWRIELLDRAVRPAPAIAWEDALPEVLGPSTPADWMMATIHELVGLAGRPLVGPGTADLMAGALAAAVPVGTCAAILGEDPAVVTVVDRSGAVADTSGRVRCFADATGHLMPTVSIAPIGRALDGVARMLGTDAAGLAALAARADPRTALEAPVLVPARDHRPGALLGLGDASGPVAIAVGALHGCAAEILAAVKLLGVPAGDGIVLAGRDADRPGLAQAVADLSDAPVTLQASAGGAPTEALGAAVQAAAMMHEQDPLDVASAWGLGGGTAVEPAAPFPLDGRHTTIQRWREYTEKH